MFERLKKIILLHKQKQALNEINRCNDFNSLMIKSYLTDDWTELEQKYPTDWFGYGMRMNENYLREIGINEIIIRVHKLICNDAIRIRERCEKIKRKENLDQRIKFIESELNDIKRRMN